jgi:predicted enzyme related to lactoylglutathione lyase
VKIHYLEIVSNDVDAVCAVYERAHGLSFAPEDPDLGQARVAGRPDGSLLGVRKPMAGHEQPTMRTYVEVADIKRAVEQAEAAGATVAYPPTRQGERGTFAILIQGEVEHGLWQR